MRQRTLLTIFICVVIALFFSALYVGGQKLSGMTQYQYAQSVAHGLTTFICVSPLGFLFIGLALIYNKPIDYWLLNFEQTEPGPTEWNYDYHSTR